MTLSTTEEFNTLMTPPLTTKPLEMSIWMWEPAS